MKRVYSRQLGRLGRVAAVGVFSAVLTVAATTSATAASPKTNSLAAAYNSWAAPQALVGGIFGGVPVTMRCWRDGVWANGTNRWFLVEGAGYNPYTGRPAFVRGFVSANKISNQITVGRCP